MTDRRGYKDPRWQKLRLECFERDGWRCCACGNARDTLHCHYKRYRGKMCYDAVLDDLQTLCEHCHDELGEHPRGGLWWDSSYNCAGKILVVEHCKFCGSRHFAATYEMHPLWEHCVMARCRRGCGSGVILVCPNLSCQARTPGLLLCGAEEAFAEYLRHQPHNEHQWAFDLIALAGNLGDNHPLTKRAARRASRQLVVTNELPRFGG